MLIVGAGVAGLACGRVLAERGIDVRLIEKSRGVGGRCATRRIEGQPVDHGLAFYHGDDLAFLAALASVETEAGLPWPRRVEGEGVPCQPRAFRADQTRVAFAGGVTAFPKHLAHGLTIDLETRAVRLESGREGLAVTTESGARYVARSLVLAPPVAQTVELLRTLGEAASVELQAITELLDGIAMVRCLTVMAGYPADTPAPSWDVCYPQDSDILQMVSQDSTKRPAREPVFVFQSRPGWSVERWDDPAETWAAGMLAAARDVCGDWVTEPTWTDTRRWRYARLTGGNTLTAPLVVPMGNGIRIGIAGEAMAEGGGVQAAWLSGRRLAARLIGDDDE